MAVKSQLREIDLDDDKPEESIAKLNKLQSLPEMGFELPQDGCSHIGSAT